MLPHDPNIPSRFVCNVFFIVAAGPFLPQILPLILVGLKATPLESQRSFLAITRDTHTVVLLSCKVDEVSGTENITVNLAIRIDVNEYICLLNLLNFTCEISSIQPNEYIVLVTSCFNLNVAFFAELWVVSKYVYIWIVLQCHASSPTLHVHL